MLAGAATVRPASPEPQAHRLSTNAQIKKMENNFFIVLLRHNFSTVKIGKYFCKTRMPDSKA
jgi:hypothetical protein